MMFVDEIEGKYRISGIFSGTNIFLENVNFTVQDAEMKIETIFQHI
jgi:hypothetical protein